MENQKVLKNLTPEEIEQKNKDPEQKQGKTESSLFDINQEIIKKEENIKDTQEKINEIRNGLGLPHSKEISPSIQQARESIEKLSKEKSIEDLMNNFNIDSLPEETKEEYISRILSDITRIGRTSENVSLIKKKITYVGRSVNEKVIDFFESNNRLKKFKDRLFETQKKDNIKFSDGKNKKIFDTFLNKIGGASKETAGQSDDKLEYYNNTNQLRNFFDRNREEAGNTKDNHSYALMMFGLPENFIKTQEGKEYLHNELDNKTIFLFGGGDSIKDLLKSEEFKPKRVINFDPFVKEESIDKNPEGIYESQMISASDKKIREMTENNEIPKADEVWATYSVPFYLDSSEDIKELIKNMTSVLSEGGNARISPIAVQSTEKDGENFETRKQVLIDSIKSLLDSPDYNITVFNDTLKIHKIKKQE